jgi:hypothetical protein
VGFSVFGPPGSRRFLASLLASLLAARAASLSVAPQVVPKISPLRAPYGHRERSPGAATPPSGGSKRPPSPGGPPPATPARAQQHGGLRFCRAPRQPEQNSTARFVFTERARRQSEDTTARRRALLHGATSTARAQQHGGARFCRSGHGSQGTACSSTAACASIGRDVSQSNTARRGLLPQSAHLVSPRAQQHGDVRFCVGPRQQPEHSSAGARASAERHDNQSAAARRRALLQSGGHGKTKRCTQKPLSCSSQLFLKQVLADDADQCTRTEALCSFENSNKSAG